MEFSEIIYRLRNKIQAALEKHGYGLAISPPAPVGKSGFAWLPEISREFNTLRYVDAANRVLNGKFDIFASHGINLGFPPKWNVDSKTGTMAPMLFGKTLDYRDEELVGDIKYLWEPNRHLELVTLAQAWHLTGDTKYSDGCRVLLMSWFDQCIYPNGPNWVSSLEHAVRLVNWSFAWHILGGEHSELFQSPEGERLHSRWLTSIYQHCHFIAGHLSLYSSANNHLLGEYMGLFVASTTWPLWSISRNWNELAYEGFLREALKQNTKDGVNQEQAIWYHHEVADMMLISGLIGKANSIEFPDIFWQRLEAMMEFISSVMDVGGNVPMIGDSDDAIMVGLCPDVYNVYRSLLATGSVLFTRGDFRVKAVEFDDKTRWLLGNEAATIFDSSADTSAKTPIRQNFPEGGYYIMGADFESPQEIKIVADAGTLGYLSIAAHGHADALSITLSVGGREILVDTGTYAYHTKNKWRDYFRGTAAHNTVRVDQLDQSESGGNFMWLRKASSCCELWFVGSEKQKLIASHDGYSRLCDPVTHRRTIEIDKADRHISLTDTLNCNATHEVERIWHFSESCSVSVVNSQINVVNKEVDVTIRLPETPPESIKLYKGNKDPVFGWISRHFDQKIHTSTIVERMSISGITCLVAEIECK